MNYKDALEYQVIFTQAAQLAKKRNKFEDCTFDIDIESFERLLSEALPKYSPERIRQMAKEIFEYEESA